MEEASPLASHSEAADVYSMFQLSGSGTAPLLVTVSVEEASPLASHSEAADVYSMFQLSGSGTAPLLVTVNVNQVNLQMEIDTGASVSVINKKTY